ncbi:MAG: prepilin-type N-terminal cleavage/methylation domain-containing protein [Thermodesulfobacteriota bacterium]|nr:prepilin-type N-terminal cleavage/methylation domain-containing protein [Thermodesulfobacteriota bacterium]
MGKDESGFTLVETIVTLGVVGILMVSIYSLYISQIRTFTVQEQITDMQQNGRVAMNIVSRDIRMAGFGQPSWTTINGTSGIHYTGIQVTDGGTGEPDSFEIIGCIDPPTGTLSNGASQGATTITLHSQEVKRFNTTTKRDIFIGERENVKVISISGSVLTIDTDPTQSGNQGLANGYPANTNVYLVKRVRYSIHDNSLRCNENMGSGAQEIAMNVEDLQVTFIKPIVNISMTVRTEKKDRDWSGDGYHRITLDCHVIARNLK